MPAWTIGRVAEQSGVNIQTIRYYEQIGLLATPARSAGNQRLYSQAALDRLAFIRHARDLGFSLDAVRELLRMSDHPEESCAGVDAIAQRRLVEVEDRIRRLEALRTELKRLISHGEHGTVADCRIIEALSGHHPA